MSINYGLPLLHKTVCRNISSPQQNNAATPKAKEKVMSGCFSNVDREDRAMEADLFRFLDSQQESDAVAVSAEDMIKKSANIEYAKQITFDYECMIEKLPELISKACEAKVNADGIPQFSARAWIYEQLGREVAKMVESEMMRIASFQENCDA